MWVKPTSQPSSWTVPLEVAAYPNGWIFYVSGADAGNGATSYFYLDMRPPLFEQAVRLAPALGNARYLYGLALGREARHAEAAEQFREAVRLMPDLIEARLNLGTALRNQGRSAEALAEFEAVLARNPTNPVATRATQKLRAQLSVRSH